ncbi:acetyltransferase [Klebsiella grimontii]|uniref:Acetyltransferase n=1 Tax=Klebsiella grimontii TaxID=2058152 RepID=A0A7H4PC33_9ENTR|nr:acetyltransferase [Klebsiella grimontii]
MHTLRETAIRNVASGENVVIYQPANLYDCTLGDNVFVGPFVEIQGHTRIGNDSKNSVPHLYLRVRDHRRALFYRPRRDVRQRYVPRGENPTPTARAGEEL